MLHLTSSERRTAPPSTRACIGKSLCRHSHDKPETGLGTAVQLNTFRKLPPWNTGVVRLIGFSLGTSSSFAKTKSTDLTLRASTARSLRSGRGLLAAGPPRNGLHGASSPGEVFGHRSGLQENQSPIQKESARSKPLAKRPERLWNIGLPANLRMQPYAMHYFFRC